MFTIEHVTSLDLPELQPYRTMRRQMAHREQGIFVAEGEKVVRRLLNSRFGVVSALMPDKWIRELQPLFEQRPEMIRVFVADKALLETLTGFSMYQGLLAVGKIPEPMPLEAILVTVSQPYLLVALDELANAENLGALVRNCVAFGTHALIVGETSSSPFLRRAVRSSMGTVFELPIIETPNLIKCLSSLKERRIRCIAAHPHVEGRTLADADFTSDCCIVFGGEGHGITPGVLALCDDAVAIPMPPTVDSLNVGSAGAVFLYEANRQRERMQNH